MTTNRRPAPPVRFLLVLAATLALTGFTFLPNTPTPGVGSSATPLGHPAELTTTSSSYAFLARNADGSPVTYDPCRAVHYVTRTANEPEDGPQIIAEAMDAASRATGLVFINDGATDESPSGHRDSFQRARYGDRWAPVLITWQTSADDWRFTNTGGGDVLGVTNSSAVQRDGTATYVTGQMALNGPVMQDMLSRGRHEAARAVVEHELGHLLGLAHVEDPAQLMYEQETGAAYTYKAGDLTGLALLGQGACRPAI